MILPIHSIVSPVISGLAAIAVSVVPTAVIAPAESIFLFLPLASVEAIMVLTASTYSFFCFNPCSASLVPVLTRHMISLRARIFD